MSMWWPTVATAAGFIFGPKGDADLAQELQQVTAKPVVTTARSMVLTLQAAGVNDIALVTPYLDAVNTQLKALFGRWGHPRAPLQQLFCQ